MNIEQYLQQVRIKMAGLVDSNDVEWLPSAEEIGSAMRLASVLQKTCEEFESSEMPRNEVTMPLAVAMLASVNLNFYKPKDESDADCWWAVLNDVANTGEIWPDLRVICDYYDHQKNNESISFAEYINSIADRENKIESVSLAMAHEQNKIDVTSDISKFVGAGIPGRTPLLGSLIERALDWEEHYSDTMDSHDIEDLYESRDVDFEGLKTFLIENGVIKSDKTDLVGAEFFDSKDYRVTPEAFTAYAVSN